MDRDYIVLITIARGIGQTPIVGGFSWGFGDDAVWQFRKAGENIQLVRRNVRFTAEQRQPDGAGRQGGVHRQRAVQPADSHKSPQGAYVVDLTPVFMSDLPQIGLVLPGFSFSPDKSDLGRSERAAEERRAASGGHVCLERRRAASTRCRIAAA